ncbi:MAG: MarR family transcriptional regulator [Dehalococcoidia bacterium]
MYDMEFVEPSMTTWTLLRQTSIAMDRVSEAKLAKKGLTPEKLAVLWACRDHPGPMTPAEIARLVFREAQTVAGLLNRLEKEGFVKRVPKRKGRPFTEIKMTPKGEEACGPGIEIFKRIIVGLSSDLSAKERDQLHKTLRALRQKMLDELHLEIDQQPVGLSPDKPIPVTW